MELFVYSRAAIERVPPHDAAHIIISITTTPDDAARLPDAPACVAIHRAAFLDADAIGEGAEGILFSEAHARALATFVLEHWSRVDRIVLHCDAGLSRSPAVAAAISRAMLGDDAEYFRRYRPNMRVYRLLLEAFWDAGYGRP
jgi:predicted protein tyrosine phosphatase